MKFTTPQEVFAFIISIYEKCDTLDEIAENSSHFICESFEYLKISRKLKDKCIKIVKANFNLVNSDLKASTTFLLLSTSKAIAENRQKEYIQIKIDYLKQLIELCEKEKI